MAQFIPELRHFCRNPRCRSKLPAPVSNPREAFCVRGCHSSFYRKRCLVCEEPLQRKREDQKICRKAKCRSTWRARSGFSRYLPSSDAKLASKTLDFIDSKTALKPDRAPVWRVAAAGAPITANSYHCATVGADEAIAAADRINAAHWRSARAGERGYRKPVAPAVELPPIAMPPVTTIAVSSEEIPAFLRRVPLAAAA